MKQKAFSLFFLALAIAGVVFFAHQTAAQTAINNPEISTTIIPSNPGANQSVTITLSSYSVDLPSAEIYWTIDGKPNSGGVGYTRFTFTTKDIGVATAIGVTITPVGALPIERTITVTPMSADLLWQATDSTVPPLYRGKAMPTSESAVRFVAIPQIRALDGSLVPASSLVYNWAEDYTNNQAVSGYGKDYFTTTMDYLNPTKHVDVSIATRDGATSTSQGIDLLPTNPFLVWYTASPLTGPVFERSIGNEYSVTGSDTSFLAEPYFFSPGNPAAKILNYSWQLNGADISLPAIPNVLFLHRNDMTKGDAVLRLSLTNPAKLFQELSASLTLHLN